MAALLCKDRFRLRGAFKNYWAGLGIFREWFSFRNFLSSFSCCWMLAEKNSEHSISPGVAGTSGSDSEQKTEARKIHASKIWAMPDSEKGALRFRAEGINFIGASFLFFHYHLSCPNNFFFSISWKSHAHSSAPSLESPSRGIPPFPFPPPPSPPSLPFTPAPLVDGILLRAYLPDMWHAGIFNMSQVLTYLAGL